MNLLTTAGRRPPYIAAVDQTGDKPEEQHPLGVPKRVIAERAAAAAAEQKQRENAAAEAFRSGNWKGAGGEQRSLEEEAKRAVSGKKSTLDPGRKPRTLEELDATEWWNQGDNSERLLDLRGGCNCCISPPCWPCSEPITQSEAEQLGLIEPDEDDGACCVPSHGDLVEAAFAFLDRTGKPHWCVTETIPGLEYVGSIYEIPADKRAAVIKALNALGA